MFHRWLMAARARRHKRVTLREKELEFDRANVQVAWNRWRERYMDEKLRPLVSSVASSTKHTSVTPKTIATPDSHSESKESYLPYVWYLAFEDSGMFSFFLTTTHMLTPVQSLPAIRFQASRTKMRYWAIWRAAMPQALLAKRARETHNDAVLSEILFM